MIKETKFYYLNSRYYDPLIGRFINADDIGMLASGELNLFKYCDNNPVTGYDPMGTWNWGRFWKITGGVVGAALAVTLVVATGGTALAIGATLVGGYTIGSNVATVIDSNIYVKINKDIEPMKEDRYNEIMISEDPSTVGLSRNEKLQYIKLIRDHDSTILNNWTEAEMLREFEYHDRGYYLGNFLGTFDFLDLEGRGKAVGFEPEQNLKTYGRRIVGNTWFW